MTRSLIRARRRPGVIGVLAAAVGMGLFGVFVARAGVGEVAEGVARLGWAFGLVVGLTGVRFVLRALAWQRCLPAGHGLSLRTLMPAVLAGDAVGNVTPLSVALGEPVKSLYLRDRAALSRTMPALAVETLFYTLSMVVVIAAGGVALAARVGLPAADRTTAAVVLAMVGVLIVGPHWLLWRRVAVARATLGWLGRVGLVPARLAPLVDGVGALEARVHEDYPRRWGRVAALVAFHAGFHVLAIVEIFVVMWFVADRPPTWVDAFVLEAGNRFVNVAFKFVPLRIGVDEAGTAMLTAWLGMGTTLGVTMAVIRKGRMLVWTAVGVAALVRRGLWRTGGTPASGAGAPGGAAVVVMARAPFGARAPKSRLRDAIPAEADRRRLYAAFLRDTVAGCRALAPAAVRVAYAPEGGVDGFGAAGVGRDELLAQRGGDLGARERGVFEDLFAAGFSTVVMIGSDLPTLPAARVAEALARAAPATVVLGPATDGGYYLMALAAPPAGQDVPDLFSGIGWGTAEALADTRRAAARAGVRVHEIAPWYDVDDGEGLERLRRDLTDTAHAHRARATAQAMRDIVRRDRP